MLRDMEQRRVDLFFQTVIVEYRIQIQPLEIQKSVWTIYLSKFRIERDR